MGKKVKEYKSGDFIFAKVKGYPAWPARVQKLNGKKYFVYFYGTGETANLPPNMIFDYAENKDKFLTKSVKRRDFNDGVKQIEYDFANNIPLEDVIGVNPEAAVESGNDTANDTANETMETTADTTAADDTVADTTVSTQNNTAIEDSDENVALVIDEGKSKAKKSKGEPSKTPAKETPAKETAKEVPAKTPKTPRGKPKKDEQKPDEEEEKRDEEIVSRSGRKIRPKRYMDEQTEENTTLPSPAPKRKRGASPAPDKDKATDKTATKDQPTNKNIKHFNNVSQSVLEHLKEPFKPADADKDNLLMAYLPTAQYVGIKLFQSRPNSFKNDTSKLQWERQAASNAITLKMQLEKGDITTSSIIAQLVMDLNLTDEEKARLDKERETDEKKHRVHFLKMEMRLIELDAKIKTCLCLEKADTTLCLELLDEFMKLELTPLMLLKHPTCLETVKRMRAYVGNTPSWDLSESDALEFSKQAHKIRKQADCLYKIMKDQFTVPEGLTFWEFFSERVLQFKKATAALHADQLLELVHMPLMMSSPTSHTTKAAIDAANDEESLLVEDEEPQKKKRDTQGKSKKSLNASTAQNNTPAKTPLKRQASRKQDDKEKTKDSNEKDKQTKEKDKQTKEKEKGTTEKEGEAITAEAEVLNESSEIPEEPAKESNPEESSKELADTEAVTESESLSEPAVEPNTEIEEKESEDKSDNATESSDKTNDIDKKSSDKADKKSNATAEKSDKKATIDKPDKKIDKSDKKTNEKSDKKAEKSGKKSDKSSTDKSDDSNDKSDTTNEKESEKDDTNEIADKSEKEDKSSKEQKEKQDVDEPRAKRSRGETKKTETPPPRSPAKRKLKS